MPNRFFLLFLINLFFFARLNGASVSNQEELEEAIQKANKGEKGAADIQIEDDIIEYTFQFSPLNSDSALRQTGHDVTIRSDTPNTQRTLKAQEESGKGYPGFFVRGGRNQLSAVITLKDLVIWSCS